MTTKYKDLKSLKQDIEFEVLFYETVAKTRKIQVVALPDADGDYATPQELNIIKKQCVRKKLKLLYRISHGQLATVFDPNTMLTGIMPEDSIHGFVC